MLAFCRSVLLITDIERNEWKHFTNLFYALQWNVDSPYDFRSFEIDLLKAFSSVPFHCCMQSVLETLWQDAIARDIVKDFVRTSMDDDAIDIWNVVHALSDAAVNEWTPWDMKILWADHADMDVDYDDLYARLFMQSNPLETEPLLWQIATKRSIDVAKAIATLSFPQWRRCVQYFVREGNASDQRRMLVVLRNTSDDTVFAQYLFYGRAVLEKNALCADIEDHNEEEILLGLKQFAESCIRFYQNCYTQEALTEHAEYIDTDCRTALKIQALLAQPAKENTLAMECIELLRSERQSA